MKCKNCLKQDVCIIKQNRGGFDDTEHCVLFEDKSQWVKLPDKSWEFQIRNENIVLKDSNKKVLRCLHKVEAHAKDLAKQKSELRAKLDKYEELGSVEDFRKNKKIIDRIIDNEMCMAKIDRKEREKIKEHFIYNFQTLTELGVSLFAKQAEIEDLKRKLKTYEKSEEQGLNLKD